MVAAKRHAAGDPFGDGHDIGRNAKVLRGKHLAGSTHAALHFVVNEQDAVFIGDAAQLFVELGRRNNVTAFALNRLPPQCRRLLRQGGLS